VVYQRQTTRQHHAIGSTAQTYHPVGVAFWYLYGKFIPASENDGAKITLLPIKQGAQHG